VPNCTAAQAAQGALIPLTTGDPPEEVGPGVEVVVVASELVEAEAEAGWPPPMAVRLLLALPVVASAIRG
jgi:hypothetical protein